MKKVLLGLIFLVGFGFMVPLVTNAQTCSPRQRNVSRSYYNNSSYYNRNDNYNRNRRSKNIFRNRNVRNIALATGGGALVGGLLGGNRKSMLKGAIVGAGAGALYTYVIKPKRTTYRRY